MLSRYVFLMVEQERMLILLVGHVHVSKYFCCLTSFRFQLYYPFSVKSPSLSCSFYVFFPFLVFKPWYFFLLHLSPLTRQGTQFLEQNNHGFFLSRTIRPTKRLKFSALVSIAWLLIRPFSFFHIGIFFFYFYFFISKEILLPVVGRNRGCNVSYVGELQTFRSFCISFSAVFVYLGFFSIIYARGLK